MPNNRTRLPLPDCKGVYFDGYSAQTMREYADSENAALREINSALCAKSNGYVADNARLSEQVRLLREALDVAVRQNECDMMMTGEELRKCRAALETAK